MTEKEAFEKWNRHYRAKVKRRYGCVPDWLGLDEERRSTWLAALRWKAREEKAEGKDDHGDRTPSSTF